MRQTNIGLGVGGKAGARSARSVPIRAEERLIGTTLDYWGALYLHEQVVLLPVPPWQLISPSHNFAFARS
jgi:hypothetical protein